MLFDDNYMYIKEFLINKMNEKFGKDIELMYENYSESIIEYFEIKFKYIPLDYEIEFYNYHSILNVSIYDSEKFDNTLWQLDRYDSELNFNDNEQSSGYINLLKIEIIIMKLKKILLKNDFPLYKTDWSTSKGKTFKKYKGICKRIHQLEYTKGDITMFEKYLNLRNRVLDYTNEDMNLSLSEDGQVYIALFDIPIESNILDYHTKTLALIYGLNTHIYYSTGDYLLELEKNKNVMTSMQSLLLSIKQVLKYTNLLNNTDFYKSDKIRMYLKTRKGIHFKEIDLNSTSNEDKFVLMLLNNILKEVN